MFKFLAISVCSVLIAGSIALVDRKSVESFSAPHTAAASELPSQIYATGIVEGRTEDVDLRPDGAGRVQEVLVRLGDWVDAGQVLLRLDDRTERAQVAASRAKLQLEQAKLDRLVNGARDTERAEARALLREKQARLHLAVVTWNRVKTLRAQDAIAQQEADDQEGVVHALDAEVEACQERLNQLESPAREDELNAAKASVAYAQAEYELTQVALDRTALRAPVRAQVLDVNIEPGEMIMAGRTEPVIVLADTAQLRVRAFVEEIDAPRIAVGVKARISADGLPNRNFDAFVATVSPRMNTKSITTDRPNELYDSKVREVVLDVAVPADDAKLLVGLRVDVLFDVGVVQPSLAKNGSTLSRGAR